MHTSTSAQNFIGRMHVLGSSRSVVIRVFIFLIKIVNLVGFFPLLVQIRLIRGRDPSAAFRANLFPFRVRVILLNKLFPFAIPNVKKSQDEQDFNFFQCSRRIFFISKLPMSVNSKNLSATQFPGKNFQKKSCVIFIKTILENKKSFFFTRFLKQNTNTRFFT